MKNKIFNNLVVISFLILFLEVLFNKSIIFDTISYSLNIWVNNLIPSMFPFFIISDILINYGFIKLIPKFIKNIFSNLFNVGDNLISIFFLSILSGFPSSARITRNLYDKKIIDVNEANHILMFTHFANPLFILSTVGITFLGYEKYGIIILISHYLGNVIIGIIFRSHFYNNHTNYNSITNKSQSFSNILIKSIKSSIDTLLLILGTLTCFLIISSLIINRLNLSLYPASIIKGILEMTMGLNSLSLLNIPYIYKVVISTMFISFGGLAIHMQVISQIVDTDISYHYFFIARIIHSIISGSICYLLFMLLF